jgi:hypothetical protein
MRHLVKNIVSGQDFKRTPFEKRLKVNGFVAKVTDDYCSAHSVMQILLLTVFLLSQARGAVDGRSVCTTDWLATDAHM